MRRSPDCVVLAMALLVLGGCASGRDFDLGSAVSIAMRTGVKAVEASRPMNESEEYYLGRAVAARILSSYPLYQDQGLTLYVNEVGQAVARKSSRPSTFRGYHFAVLDSQEPNAFACPGGIVFITRGLLKMCEMEDELAAVLAHEVSHVASRDGISSISQARWTKVLTALGTDVAKQYGGSLGELVSLFEGSIDDVFKTIVVNGYSRSAEENADAAAATFLKEAGYNPKALTALLTKMRSQDKKTGGIFATHPPTGDRLDALKALGHEPPVGSLDPVRTSRFTGQRM